MYNLASKYHPRAYLGSGKIFLLSYKKFALCSDCLISWLLVSDKSISEFGTRHKQNVFVGDSHFIDVTLRFIKKIELKSFSLFPHFALIGLSSTGF